MNKRAPELTEEQRTQVLADFKQWSGGYPPSESSPDELARYVRYARPEDLSARRVREFLFKAAGFEGDEE